MLDKNSGRIDSLYITACNKRRREDWKVQHFLKNRIVLLAQTTTSEFEHIIYILAIHKDLAWAVDRDVRRTILGSHQAE